MPSTALRASRVFASCLVAALTATPAAADEVADFYKGKTVTMLIASGPGGGYNEMARLLSRHMGKYIPGNPTFVNQNMPGAGGIRAANYLYHRAPRDGLIVSATYRGIAFEPFFRPDAARYKPLEFVWLGSAAKDSSLMLTLNPSKVKSLADLKHTQVVLGSTRADQQDYAVMAKNLLGLNLKIVIGYGSTTEVVLAMERGEVDGITAYAYDSLRNSHNHWVQENKVNMLLQFALEKHPALPHVPLITDLATNPLDRGAMEMMYARQQIARPYIMAPGVPKARVDALKAAFMATTKDSDYIAEAKRMRFEISPMSGDEVVTLIKRVSAYPGEVAERARAAISNTADLEQVRLKEFVATVAELKKRGPNLSLSLSQADGKVTQAVVSPGLSKITVASKAADNDALREGMRCSFAYTGPGGVAFKVACD